MKTYSIKPSDIKKKWVIIDAADQTLGRIASEIAAVLRGKNKPTFVQHLDTGDNVIVINAAKVKLTGKKWTDKLYQHHTGWIGHLKSVSARDVLATHPERLITHAVKGMLPKNKLGKKLGTNFRVFADDKHGQDAQKPVVSAPRTQK